MTVRAIIFDLGDTLFRLDPMPDPQPAIARLLARESLGPPGGTAALAGRLMDNVAAQRRATKDFVESDLVSMFRGAISRAALPAPPGLAESCSDILGDADISRVAAPADLAEELTTLRDEGFLLGAVSNTTTRGELLDALLEATGVLPGLDHVVYSSVHGFKKPHRSIYEAVLTELGVRAGDALFVGDRVREDVLGPQSVGMQAVLTHQYRQEPVEGAEPLAVIRHLAELRVVAGSL